MAYKQKWKYLIIIFWISKGKSLRVLTLFAALLLVITGQVSPLLLVDSALSPLPLVGVDAILYWSWRSQKMLQIYFKRLKNKVKDFKFLSCVKGEIREYMSQIWRYFSASCISIIWVFVDYSWMEQNIISGMFGPIIYWIVFPHN